MALDASASLRRQGSEVRILSGAPFLAISEGVMAASIEEITKEVVELPRHQRLTLVRLLLDLDQPGTGHTAASRA
jgi:hypothetical protein